MKPAVSRVGAVAQAARVAALLVVVALSVPGTLACSKSSDAVPTAVPAPSTSTPGTGGAIASAGAAVSAAAAPPASAAAASSSWTGTYKSTASAITVVPEWKKVHWSDTQSTQGVGDGTIALAVDGTTGRVTGTLEGPLGPATLDGAVVDGKLSATLVRKDPSDQGFTGTLLGTVAADKVEGTMNVSPGGGGTVRTVTFTLARAPGH